MKSLQESMREAENKKRSLEECVDALREECAKLKAAGELTFHGLCHFSINYRPLSFPMNSSTPTE